VRLTNEKEPSRTHAQADWPSRKGTKQGTPGNYKRCHWRGVARLAHRDADVSHATRVHNGRGGCLVPARRPNPQSARRPRQCDLHPRWSWERKEHSPDGGLHLPSWRPLSLALRRSQRLGTHPLLHLSPSHHRPLRARASPGEAASINPNHRPRHQVKPIDGAFIFESPLELWNLDYACTCTFPCACEL